MKNTRTFWSVDYTGVGYNGTHTAWFDSKEEAVKFSEKDYRDAPVRHTVSSQATIDKYTELCEMTRAGY